MGKRRKILLTIIFLSLFSFCAIIPTGVLAASKKKESNRPKQYKVVVPGVFSRSGLPSSKQFKTLQNLGVKSMINLIPASETGRGGDAGALGFRYLYLPIIGSFPPTIEQANKFLSFIKNSGNWPVHVFCRAGNARTGTLVAVYRYSVQGWTMQKAIRESKRFGGGLSKKQIAWLNEWARTHASGAYPK